jgi:hypothetical protein
MTTRRSTALSLLTSAFLVLVAATPANARWLGEQTLGHVSYFGGQDVALASDAHGDAVVAWAAADGIRVAFARAGARFGASSLISGSKGGAGPAVALDDQGAATVAWTFVDNFYIPPIDSRDGPCCNRVRAASFRRGRKVGPTQTLTPRGTDAVLDAVAVAHGHAGIVDEDEPVDPATGAIVFGSGRVRLSLAVPPGRFRSPARIVAAGGVGARSLTLGARAATVVYGSSALGGLIPVNLFSAKLAYSGGSAVSRPLGTLPLGLPFGLGETLLLAGDAHGGQAGLFTQGGVRQPQTLELATRTAGGRFATRPVDTLSQGSFGVPALAVAPSGLGLVTWSRNETGAVRVALAAVGRHVRDVGILHPLKTGTELYSGADAVNTRGQAAIVVSTEGVGRSGGVRAILRSARGGYTAARDLDSPGVVLAKPLVVIDAHGRGVVVWEPGTSVRAERFRAG